MRAFAQQIEIEVAKDRRKAVGVFELDLGLAEPGAQPIAPRAVRQRAGEQAGIMDARSSLSRPRSSTTATSRGVGQEDAHHLAAVLGVQAEIVEGIGVTAFDDRIGLGR